MILRAITLAVFIITASSPSLLAAENTRQWFKKSVVTITDLSEVPGVVLEPGTYVFRVEEGTGNRRTLVELLNKDESQLLTSFMAVPDHRQRPDYDTIITFFPNITEGPRPIQTWFYPGEMNGYEFVYPKPRAKEIAKKTEDHVMASETTQGSIVAVTSNGTEVPIYDAPGAAPGKAKMGEDTEREKPQSSTTTTTTRKATKRARTKQP